MKIQKIREKGKIFAYLQKRNLVDVYKKSKQQILEGNYQAASLKIRQPKKQGIYYFRINNQYRAFATRIEDTLIVFEISDHQNS